MTKKKKLLKLAKKKLNTRIRLLEAKVQTLEYQLGHFNREPGVDLTHQARARLCNKRLDAIEQRSSLSCYQLELEQAARAELAAGNVDRAEQLMHAIEREDQHTSKRGGGTE